MDLGDRSVQHLLTTEKAAEVNSSDLHHIVVAHTGLEPVISALRGQRVNQLHQCAAEVRIIGAAQDVSKLRQVSYVAPSSIVAREITRIAG